MKRITMQHIADALGISRVTVWKVFNDQEGVSDTLSKQVLDKAAELGYSKHGMDKVQPLDIKTISVVVSRPESSMFWMNIIHQIAKELAKENIQLLYTYLPTVFSNELPTSLSDPNLDGIIVLNVYNVEYWNLINDLNIPKVFLDIPTSIHPSLVSGDCLILEGYSPIYSITEYLISSGRKCISFIGDTEYAKTNMDRYLGYKAAMENYSFTLDDSFSLTKSIELECYPLDIVNFLNNLSPFPDAFVCASDYVANFVVQFLSEHGYSVPDDVAVSGFDKNSEYFMDSEFLTTVPVDTSYLGKRLVRQLLDRIKYQNSPFEMVSLILKAEIKRST